MLNVGINPSHPGSFHLHNRYFHFLLLRPLFCSSACTPFLFVSPHPPWTLPPPQLSCYLAEVGFWLAAPWALVNSVKQPAARLCNCNEGQKERRQGTELFSRSVSRHTFPRNHSFPFFPFRPLPNYICILLSRPLSPWRGSERKRLKRRKADITFACISYAAALLK